jgi:hypothetical protein
MMQEIILFKLCTARDFTAVDDSLVCSSLQVEIFRINTSAVVRILLILPV